MPTFNIWGTLEVQVDFEVEAIDENEARKKAIAILNDNYHLDAHGGEIVRNSAKHNWYVDDINE